MAHRKLFLDDIRKPYDITWDVVRDYDSFVQFINEQGCPDVISFDHDLAFERYPLGEQDPTLTIPYEQHVEKSGWHAAKWLVENGHIPQLAIIHSMNIVGAKNIFNVLNAAGIQSVIQVYNPNKPIRIARGERKG